MTTKKLNVLICWPAILWREKQSAARRHYAFAMMKRDDVTTHISGPGFPDWNNHWSGTENISKIMPGCNVVWGYKLGGCEKGSIKNPLEMSESYLTCEGFNESWCGMPGFKAAMHPGGGTAVDECRKAGTRLVVCHHPQGLDDLSGVQEYGGRLFFNPHCSEPDFFAAHSLPWDQRRDVCLTGVIGGDHYPGRGKWAKLSDSLKATRHSRPPQRVSSTDEADAMVHKYAEILGSHKLVLGCSSRWKYPLNRFTEAAMAGCIHVSDMPDGNMFGYDTFISAVDFAWDDDKLVSHVRTLLADDNALRRMSEQAQAIALQYYKCSDYVDRLLAEIRTML